MPDEYESFDYADVEFQSIEDLKKNHDYDTHTFDIDKDKNRRKHVTDPKKRLRWPLKSPTNQRFARR